MNFSDLQLLAKYVTGGGGGGGGGCLYGILQLSDPGDLICFFDWDSSQYVQY